MIAVRSSRPSTRLAVATPMSESATLGGMSSGASGGGAIVIGDGRGRGETMRGANANRFLKKSGSVAGCVGRTSVSRTSGTGTRRVAPPAGRRTRSGPVMSRAAAPVRPKFARTSPGPAPPRRPAHGTKVCRPAGARRVSRTRCLRTIPGLGWAGRRRCEMDQNRHRTARSARPTNPLGAELLLSQQRGIHRQRDPWPKPQLSRDPDVGVESGDRRDIVTTAGAGYRVQVPQPAVGEHLVQRRAVPLRPVRLRGAKQ